MDIVDRIFELADRQFPEQRDFASRIGTVPSVISAWRTRKSASYNRRLPQIAQVLNTTVEYLVTGETTQPDEDPILAAALSKFRQLTPAQRAAVQMMIDSLAAQNESKADTE